MNKTIIGIVFIGAVLGTLAFFNLTPFKNYVQAVLGNSAAGTTFNTAKIAAVAVNLASPGSTGTSTSIINGDANDRYVTGIRAVCNGLGTSYTGVSGAGLASLTLTIATSSTASPASLSNANKVGSSAITISTSTVQFGISSSTLSTMATTSTTGTIGLTGVSVPSIIWASGSYMTFLTNATNTALCTYGVDYLGS